MVNMRKTVRRIGLDYQTHLANEANKDKWYDLGIKRCNDYFAIRFWIDCSDTTLCKYLGIDLQNYRELMKEKYNVFCEGDTTFFHKQEEAEEVIEWVHSMLLMKKFRGELNVQVSF